MLEERPGSRADRQAGADGGGRDALPGGAALAKRDSQPTVPRWTAAKLSPCMDCSAAVGMPDCWIEAEKAPADHARYGTEADQAIGAEPPGEVARKQEQGGLEDHADGPEKADLG